MKSELTVSNEAMPLSFTKEDNGNWYIDLPEWEGDKAYLELKEGLYKAAISDCAACLLLDKDQVDECIDTAWQKVEE